MSIISNLDTQLRWLRSKKPHVPPEHLVSDMSSALQKIISGTTVPTSQLGRIQIPHIPQGASSTSTPTRGRTVASSPSVVPRSQSAKRANTSTITNNNTNRSFQTGKITSTEEIPEEVDLISSDSDARVSNETRPQEPRANVTTILLESIEDTEVADSNSVGNSAPVMPDLDLVISYQKDIIHFLKQQISHIYLANPTLNSTTRIEELGRSVKEYEDKVSLLNPPASSRSPYASVAVAGSAPLSRPGPSSSTSKDDDCINSSPVIESQEYHRHTPHHDTADAPTIVDSSPIVGHRSAAFDIRDDEDIGIPSSLSEEDIYYGDELGDHESDNEFGSRMEEVIASSEIDTTAFNDVDRSRKDNSVPYSPQPNYWGDHDDKHNNDNNNNPAVPITMSDLDDESENENMLVDSENEDMIISSITPVKKNTASINTLFGNKQQTPVSNRTFISVDEFSSSPQGIYSQLQFADVSEEETFPFTDKMFKTLKDVFGLTSFRGNQLKAINATLTGRDVLVLMPTGGGKSLCYQLPALISDGTTVVISPLISLMQDQIEHLKEKNISAEVINSKCSPAERKEKFELLASNRLKLLYLSPEMLHSSNRMESELSKLNRNGMLARIVIDEAHCVSSWGHDFRPDYKRLDQLKNDYPNVPIMALTATANIRVRLDIQQCLRPEKTTFLQQSFNRPNLHYSVVKKEGSTIMDKMVEIIEKHRNKSGIIYCSSKATCESTADNLKKLGVSADFYHAGLDAQQRETIQNRWQKGRVKVICATIAFGMGIDKADVRFVIHFALPRTMEGYYQETGRAGRDGNTSDCVLFYSYRDAANITLHIDKDETITNKDLQKQYLKRVVQYCDNRKDCRRQQVLQYFNETFDPKLCNGTCDNCENGANCDAFVKDISDISKEIVDMVGAIQKDQITILHSIDAYRGSRLRKIMNLGHSNAPNFGKGKNVDRVELDRIFHHLISEEILTEYTVYNKAGFAQSYVKKGKNANRVSNGSLKVTIVDYVPKNGFASSTGGTTSRAGPAPRKRSLNPQQPGPSNKKARSDDWMQLEQRYGQLEIIRERVRKQLGITRSSQVCSDETLRDLVSTLPSTLDTFRNAKGITDDQVDMTYTWFRPILMKMKADKENNRGTQSKPRAKARTTKPRPARSGAKSKAARLNKAARGNATMRSR